MALAEGDRSVASRETPTLFSAAYRHQRAEHRTTAGREPPHECLRRSLACRLPWIMSSISQRRLGNGTRNSEYGERSASLPTRPSWRHRPQIIRWLIGLWAAAAVYMAFDRFLHCAGYRPHPQGRGHCTGHVRFGSEAQSHEVWMADHPRFHEWVIAFTSL